MPGEVRGDHVWVAQQSEANRLYNRGLFGEPRSGGSLALDFVEAAFLLENGRLVLEDGASGTDLFERFYTRAATQQPDFEIRFLAYRELRERGYPVRVGRGNGRFHLAPKGSTNTKKIITDVWALSERTPVRASELADFVRACADAKRSGLIAVVDEESEVTMYEVASEEPRGETPPSPPTSARATYLGDRCIVWDERAAARLHEREFYGKPVAGRLHLSLVESLHLSESGGLAVVDADGKALGPAPLLKLARKVEPGIDLRRAVFDDLKARHLVVKTGYKFGAHFRAYRADPANTHAPFLVHAVAPDDVLEWPTISRAVRLAHGVRKTLVLALVGKRSLAYLRLGRAR